MLWIIGCRCEISKPQTQRSTVSNTACNTFVALYSDGIILHGPCVYSTFDESAVLRTMCTHLALLDRLVLVGVTKLTSLRSQQPVWVCVLTV